MKEMKMACNMEDKVRELAYLMAEKEGFQGCPVSYWLAAEQELTPCTAPKAKKVAPKKKPATKKR